MAQSPIQSKKEQWGWGVGGNKEEGRRRLDKI